MRMQFDPKLTETIDRLGGACNLTRGEVVLRAITLLKICVEAAQDGDIIGIVDRYDELHEIAVL